MTTTPTADAPAKEHCDLPGAPSGALSGVLRALRVGLHVTFAFLLGFGLVRAGVDDRLTATAAVLALLLAAVYLAGTVVQKRRNLAPMRFPVGVRYAWLGAVAALWLGLVLHAQDFVWLEFPLVFVFLTAVPGAGGIASAVCLWATAAFVPAWYYPETWSAGAALGPAIGTAFAVATFYAYRALHAEALHHRAVAEQLRATQGQLAATQREAGRLEERERLAREIHDTVAQGLSSIVLLARAARGSVAAGSRRDGAAEQQLSTIEQVASENLAEARRFVRDLSSPAVDDLPGVLEALLGQLRASDAALGHSTSYELRFSGDTHRTLPEPVAAAVARVAREGLNNVARHARAARAVVTFTVFDDAVALDVVDDGAGFRSNSPATSGFGLTGIRRRVADLGGTCSIDSSDAGTALAVWIPLTSRLSPEPGSASDD